MRKRIFTRSDDGAARLWDAVIVTERTQERIFSPFEIDSVAAILEMECLGPQKPDDFSVLASHSFRMAGE